MSATPKAAIFSVSGKVFLCGEYSVLLGGAALLAAAGPRFELRLRAAGHRASGIRRQAAVAGSVAGSGIGEASDILCVTTPDGVRVSVRGIPEGSPAARWLEIWAERARLSEDLEIEFVDPLSGAGGFGASTAQFALLSRALGGERDWTQLWREYRVLHDEEEIPPSGADLAAQMVGGSVVFSFSAAGAKVEKTALSMPGTALAVFSATWRDGRKVRTHEHLRAMGRAGLHEGIPEAAAARLEAITREAISAAVWADAGAGARFGTAIGAYARMLAELGLEAPGAFEDRAALERIDGVLGAKGTGALLADGVLVACRVDALPRVVDAALSRGLKVMEAPLLADAPGWRSE